METLISFDLEGDFGFFRKPDSNDGVQLSYNLIHKPSLMGILGAILGLGGYQKKGEWPEYYQKLRHLRLGIEPLDNHERGNFAKTLITYTNTVGYANDGSNLIVYENTLLRPKYRIYLLLNEEQALEAELLERIERGEAHFLPYFGKNECPVWWDAERVVRYDFEPFLPKGDFTLRSIFVKRRLAAASQKAKLLPIFERHDAFAYFEDLPGGFDENLAQYDLAEVAFTNWLLRADSDLEGLYSLKTPEGAPFVIQLF